MATSNAAEGGIVLASDGSALPGAAALVHLLGRLAPGARRVPPPAAGRQPPASPPPGKPEGQPELQNNGRGPSDPRGPLPVPPILPDGPERKQDEPFTAGDWFVEGLNRFWAEALGSRGDDTTELGNRIIAKQCKEVMDTEFAEGVTGEHVRGSYKDGEFDENDPRKSYLREEVVTDPTQPGLRGSRRPDLTWRIQEADGNWINVRGQSQDMDAQGNPTQRELDAVNDIKQRMVTDIIDGMRKLRPGDDIDEYTKEAKDFCRKIFRRYLKPLPGRPTITPRPAREPKPSKQEVEPNDAR
jgi:hypothetical protein